MASQNQSSHADIMPRVLLISFALALAGCSSDTSRFGDNAFTNPVTARTPEVTGSVPMSRPAPVQSSRIESRPLPQVQQQAIAPLPSHPTTVASNGVAGGGSGLANYQPPRVSRDITGTVAASPSAPAAPAAPRGAWDWSGGTAIVVKRGDTLERLSRTHRVPAAAILQANNLSTAAGIKPGQHLVIPKFSQTASAAVSAPAMRAPTPAPVAVAPAATHAAGGAHIVGPGDTLSRISRLYHVPIGSLARANNIVASAPLKIGDRIVIPGRTVASAPVPVQAPVVAAAKPPVVAPPQQKVAAAEPTQSARMLTPATDAPAAQEPVSATEATNSTPGFRWPVRGRIIAGYGAKPNGQQNDGINLSVPEGTAIKAAEDGVVAYSGNELKGYGNLVLVRHANGYVTAYAHASELLVKRGEKVRRGQTIAKSGQTGNVTSPQLHFEIRKGSSPVDPTQFLAGA